MVCKPFITNDVLYRSCHQIHFDYEKNEPKITAFLPRKTDGDYTSVQCQMNRPKEDVLRFFFDNFTDHVGYFTFTINDCKTKNIKCCDDTDPPLSYHSRVEFKGERPQRIYTAKVLSKISSYEKYDI